MENPPSNNPQPNPQPIPNMNPNQNPEGKQDRNSHIIVCLVSLRRLSSSIRGEDCLRDYLADALDIITNAIVEAQGALYNISSYRESRRQYYYNGFEL